MTAVLDASALLALINTEEGSGHVVTVLDSASMSTVNIAEVLSKLNDFGLPAELAEHIIDRLGIAVEAFDADHAARCARLRASTKSLGLSLGDRACLALAQALDATAVTADQTWESIPNVKVKLIRS